MMPEHLIFVLRVEVGFLFIDIVTRGVKFSIAVGVPKFWDVLAGLGGRDTNCHRAPGSSDVVGRDLGCLVFHFVFFPKFCNGFLRAFDIFEWFPAIVFWGVSFPSDEELMSVLLNSVVEDLLDFPFFLAIDKDGFWARECA